MRYNCGHLSGLSDEEFRKEFRKIMVKVISEEKHAENKLSDCINIELEKRDMFIKIDNNFIPYITKEKRAIVRAKKLMVKKQEKEEKEKTSI